MNYLRRWWYWLKDIPRRIRIARCNHEYSIVPRPQSRHVQRGNIISSEMPDGSNVVPMSDIVNDMAWGLAGFRDFKDSKGDALFGVTAKKTTKSAPVRCGICRDQIYIDVSEL